MNQIFGILINFQLGHLLLSGVISASLVLMPKQGLDIHVRQFWFCVTLGFIVFTITKLSLVSIQWLNDKDIVYQMANYGYFAFFLITIFGLIFYSSISKNNKKSSINQYSALIFVALIFLYLVLVPAGEVGRTGREPASSYLFFVIMDAYMAVAFWLAGRHENKVEWRVRFYWIAIAFFIYTLLDALEGFMSIQQEPLSLPMTLEWIWFTPYIMFALAFQHQLTSGDIPRQSQVKYLPPLLVFSLAFLPILHVLGHHFGLLQSKFHLLREGILIAWILLYLGIITYAGQRIRGHAKKQSSVGNDEDNSYPESQVQLDEIPFAFFELDNHGHILRCNKAAEHLVGYQATQMKSRFFSALFAKDEPLAPIFRFTEGNFAASGLVTDKVHELSLQHKLGQTVFCFASFSTTLEHNIACSLVDVTSLRMSEEHALSIKDKFLANITHEFRTPLTIIQGAIDEGLQNQTDKSFKERLIAAKVNTVRVLKMVEQLLTLSKLNSAPKLDKQAQPVSEIIRITCEQFAPVCRQKNITFSTEFVPALWANIHEDSLQQILYNLLSNAFKYSHANGEISLNMRQKSNAVTIVVQDNGCGMNQDEVSKLFERFQRAEKAKSSNTFGVGIGLSLVSELIDLHNWQLSVTSEPNEGSIFSLTIPIVDVPQDAEQQIKEIDFELEALSVESSNSTEQAAVKIDQNATRNQRLLIIEDNPDMQDYLKYLMNKSFQVHVSGKGVDGIEHAKEHIPDIIVCDLMLPDIQGYEVVENIKNDPLTSHIPILMLTAKADIDSKLKGLSVQVDDYLTKPFHADELLLRLQNLLQIRDDVQKYLVQQLSDANFSTAKVQALPSDRVQSVTPHARFLDKLQQITEKHYAEEDFSLAKLASEIAMSERQLQRKLNAALNMTPGEYLREFRLIRAKELLLQLIPVGQVAEQVGFSSQAYFTKCFKQSFDCTPSEFVKQSNSA
ncbi:MAG: ATP-binding protein [Aestuariibacter sp.]